MVTNDPLSLTQAKRLAASADTILLRATRSADLETPIGAFLRLDDGGPAYLLESVEGLDRQARRVDRLGDRPGLHTSHAMADLEQTPRADTQEGVAPEPLAALD